MHVLVVIKREKVDFYFCPWVTQARCFSSTCTKVFKLSFLNFVFRWRGMFHILFTNTTCWQVCDLIFVQGKSVDLTPYTSWSWLCSLLLIVAALLQDTMLAHVFLFFYLSVWIFPISFYICLSSSQCNCQRRALRSWKQILGFHWKSK